ncbi:hypothetical protein JCM8115_002495 [Rhodotorula mucilaginosa]
MEHQRAFTKLTKRIAIEKTILSYRLAARELGVSVQDAKQILAAYLASDPAKERGVSATYLLTGYLKQDSAANGNSNGNGTDAMDIDGLDATQSSQNGAGGEEEALAEIVKTKTMMVVQQDELEAKSALFSPAPTSHVYALVPTRLTSLALLSASALSLIRPEVREQKWKAAPESAPAYGGIVHPDGERKVSHGKREAPPMPAAAAAAAPKAGPSGTSKPAKKDQEVAAASKPVKGKGKGKEKETASSAAASKGKAKKEEPKIRPIGQLGGLFAKKLDDSATKKNKGKKKADSDDSDADGSDDDEDEEEVKPKKSIPAKRKSTSPAVSRKKPAPAAAPPKKATTAPAKKKTPEIIMDDDDEFGAWDMDEEAMLEAERAAEESFKAQAQAKAAGMSRGNSSTSTSKEASEPRKGETKAERQKRELEEMMKSDDMEIDEKKPSRAPSLSRTSSSSSVAANKSAAEKKKAAAAPAQKSLGSFFKKG